MRIIYFIPKPFSLIFGGGEIQLLKTKEAVEKLGIEVEFADFFKQGQINQDTIVHFFGCDYIFGQIGSMLAGRKIPYVVSSIYYPTGFTKWTHRLASKLPFSQIALKRSLLQNAESVLPNSEDEKKLLLDLYNLDSSKVHVVPNGIDASFRGQNPDIFFKQYLPELRIGESFVLSVGRIEERKNSLNLLRAAAKIKVPIVFIGRPLRPESNYSKNFFSELALYPGIAKHIPYLPPQSEILANAYCSAHVHALVSFVETPGIASLEAGLNGANLVVGNCKPVLEYLEGFSWVAEQKNIEDIQSKLSMALEKPRNFQKQKEHIQKNYSWDGVGEMTKHAYERILQRSHA